AVVCGGRLVGPLGEDPARRENGVDLRCTMRLAVPRRDHSGLQLPGVVYVDVATFGPRARDCAERLRRGDRVGLTGRLEQDEHRRPGGAWQVDHAVLSDQLDLPPETTKDEEEQ